MLSNTEVITNLIEACPGIESKWEEHLAWWGDEERGSYNDISVIAHYLVERVTEDQTDFFPKVFQLIEQYLVEGGEEIRNLMVVGLLEGLQNVGSWESVGYRVFEKWLGPESQLAWRYLEKLWEGKSSVMDVLREERRVRKP
jgi:hypothetical protein